MIEPPAVLVGSRRLQLDSSVEVVKTWFAYKELTVYILKRRRHNYAVPLRSILYSLANAIYIQQYYYVLYGKI